ncbi:SGNH/GDSL hydrolase family protein [Agriterribacter sp.]|uniref:SGNH/GDSL hydrolase family protein n=1 Tax=Agriterribacter sp. TaxID=2821509 RepID=UPI002B7A537E|nr:SGNH/GDSL hydrolase family protein [Agriterribacter sp.]HRO48368.1 SGNH/GDSL hydrolase family protein [Agriterribacter sp.]HRQ19375.1 SGNH/GDSL hydrolase family protein [Agriterribacter sp.]
MKKLLIAFIIICGITAFTQQKMTWVAIGDSITYLNEHADETGSSISKGYMTRVVEKLPHIQYINQGHNGWTSGGIAAEIEKLGIIKADIYSIFLGTNDWWQGRPVGVLADYQNNTGNNTVYGSFRIIINKLRSLNSHAKIILITPMQRGDFVYIANMTNNAWGSYREKDGQQLEQFAAAISAIGKYENITVVDLYNRSGITQKNMVHFKRLKDPQTGAYKNYPYPAYTKIAFHPETDEYPYPPDAINMTYDGLHPSDKGYAVIAKMLVKEMKGINNKNHRGEEAGMVE